MRFLKKFLKALLTLLVVIITFPYLFSPVYDFKSSAPFSGNDFYNPYEGIQHLKHFKGNFHCHSNSWGFLTDGRSDANTPGNILKRYSYYGYDVAGISDYMSINKASMVPGYEHGMGIKKTHQIVLGAESVVWTDFIFPQRAKCKQFILNKLKTNDNLVMLSHPSWNEGYGPDDVKLLRNYDCFEIKSTNNESLALWDTALSSGIPVFMMVNDDGHNAENPDVTGRIFNVFYADELNSKSVIAALKNGRNVGYEIPLSGDTLKQKQYHKEIALPEKVVIIRDTLHICFSDSLKQFKITGQGGVLRKKGGPGYGISYPVGKNDTYLRCECEMFNGTRIFLNPIIRGNAHSNEGSPETDTFLTILMLGIYWVGLIIVLYLIWKPRK